VRVCEIQRERERESKIKANFWKPLELEISLSNILFERFGMQFEWIVC